MRNYWAEVAEQREIERRLRAVEGIPLEALQQFAFDYRAGQLHSSSEEGANG